jgi:Ser/Thr protein kinase RdoA (MazF antagonist)
VKDEITALLSNKLVSNAAAQWSASNKIELLDNVANFVYQFQSQDQWKILRITHSSHRSEEQIIAELDWINYLHDSGVPVARPYVSKNKRLTEIFPVQNSYFTAVSFTFAPGQLIESADPAQWNTALFQNLGRIMGKMHRATKEYKPILLPERRPEWYEDDLLKNARQYLPSDQVQAAYELEDILTQFSQLPTSPDDYGLIHSDVNPTNFHVDNGKITLFDFDDCAYNWFVNDIAVAMPLYSSMFKEPDWGTRLCEYIVWFMQGYEEENHLDDKWLNLLPICMRLQNLITLVAMHASNVPGSQYHSFYELVLKTYREGHPMFNYDFREACKSLKF